MSISSYIIRKIEFILKKILDIFFSERNVENPLSILKSMIKTKNKAAHYTLFLSFISFITIPIDYVFSFYEKRICRKIKKEYPVIFVIYSSRSGSTLIYQVLANSLPLTYFNNLTFLFKRSPIVSNRIFKYFFFKSKKKSSNYHSFFGRTVGLSEVSEGAHIWNRWFLSDNKNRYLDVVNLTEEDKASMYNYLMQYCNVFKKGFIGKEGRFTFYIDVLSKIFPTSYFVRVRRNPVYIAQSLLMARKQVQGSKYVLWGYDVRKDKSLSKSSKGDGYLKDICLQVKSIEEWIDAKFNDFDDSNRIINVDYEDFCRSPNSVVREISKRIFGNEPDVDIAPFKISKEKKIANYEFNYLESFFEKQ